MNAPVYAELHCLSDFSFGRGASSARELFERAKRCGYTALAITDECSLAGIVRAHEAARETGVKLIVGSEIQLEDGPKLVLLVENQDGYTNLCGLITQGRRASTQGHLSPDACRSCIRLARHAGVVDSGCGIPNASTARCCGRCSAIGCGWPSNCCARATMRRGSSRLSALADDLGIRAVASGDVHMHVRSRRALQDTLTAIRHRKTVVEARGLLFRNGERHLRRRETLAAIYPEALLRETVTIADRCRFSLEQLRVPLSRRTRARRPYADHLAAGTHRSGPSLALAGR